MYKGPWTKPKWGGMESGGAVESGGGKMQATVLEQQ